MVNAHTSWSKPVIACTILHTKTVFMPNTHTPSFQSFARVWACLWAVLLCCVLSVAAQEVPPDLRLGILNARSEQDTQHAYAPVVERLQKELPGRHLQLVPLHWEALEQAVQSAKVDFVLTNGVQYVELRHHNALSGALVTQRIYESGVAVSTRGAVVIRHATRTDLAEFSQLRNRQLSVALPSLSTRGMLSYLAPAAELSAAGVDISRWQWQETGRAQLAVIDAVLAGKADLGFIRTGLLEDLALRGTLFAGRIEVVNPQPEAAYPVRLSTALYPEWALAALPHVDETTSRKVTAALLSMSLPQAEPTPERIAGFTIPADYGVIENQMRQLRMEPFNQTPSFTWHDIWQRYRWTLLLLMLTAASMLVLIVTLLRVQHTRKMVLNNMSDGFVRVDRQWHYLVVNLKAAKWLGRPAGDLIGKNMWHQFPEGEGHRFEAVYREAMATGKACSVEMHFPSWNRWFESRIQPDDTGLSIFFTDITDRKRQEEKLRLSEARNRAILSALPDLLFRLDAQGTVLDFQTGSPHDLYLAPETFLNRRVSDIMPPAVAASAMACIVQTLAGEPDVRLEYSLPMPQGMQQFEMRMVKIAADEVLGIARNVTERVKAQEAQRLAASVFDTSNDGVFITDAHLHVVQVNPAFTRMTGFAASDILGDDLTRLGLDVNDGVYRELLRTLQHRGEWKGEIWNRRKNGEGFLGLLSLTAVNDAMGHANHHVGVLSDMSLLKAHEDEVQRIAYHDALTGLPNRRLLADQMKAAVSRAQRSEQLMAVCYLDLDDFTQINDTLGHDAGDTVLTAVARRIHAQLRTEDTLARLGGDEFVAIVTELADVAECEALAQRLLSAVSGSIDIAGVPVRITASIGIALYPKDNVSPDTLLRHADQAMCRAKEAGRNRFHVFAAENDRDARSRRDLAHRLRQALNRKELRLFYQPKVNLRTGEVLGCEALMRWQHPEQGLLPPAAFLSDLLDGDLEIDLGSWVIDEAIRQWCEWHHAGRSPVSISVNVSSHQLLKPGFVDTLSQALARRPDFQPQALQLEILESAAITEIDQAALVMRQCLEQGVSFALDDFGTGYSSLSYFRRLPVDTLKVDQSFVRGMLSSPDDRSIVAAVVQLARAFDRQVVAEGVETLEHGQALLELGCEVAQGYAIARPMPAADVPVWCAEWHRAHPVPPA